MSDIEDAELNRKREFYFAIVFKIECNLVERLATLSEDYRYGPTSDWQENDPEIKELRELRDELRSWYFKTMDYRAVRNNPDLDPFMREFLVCPRYYAVMAWAMRRRK